MKPTLEQIKTDISVWLDGATHYIDGDFTKWIEGDEYRWAEKEKEWVAEFPNWSLEEYIKKDYEIIPRPTKAFVPEVGEWCEHSSLHHRYGNLFYIGLDPNGFKTFNTACGELVKFGDSAEFRPIKSEREKFIADALNVLSKNPTALPNELLGMLYDSGKFKRAEADK